MEVNWADFTKYVTSKYAKSYAKTILCYSKRFYHLALSGNLQEIQLLPATIRNNTIKSLVVFSKFHGFHKQLSEKLKEFDIKPTRPDTLSAFLRILNASNNDVLSWYKSIMTYLRRNEQLLTKYLLYSGLRVIEGINSFNKIIKLSKEGKLNQYYDEKLNCLCHFKYPKQFIRRTKNCFITFISPTFVNQIADSKTVTYDAIKRRLDRQEVRIRFNELRDYFGTYLVQHGLLEQEQNLLCGRIPVSIFVRHYWSPKLKELSTKVIALTEGIEKTEHYSNIKYNRRIKC
jgi:intergrase/recombinase